MKQKLTGEDENCHLDVRSMTRESIELIKGDINNLLLIIKETSMPLCVMQKVIS